MAVVRQLIPKRLTLIKRTWTNKTGHASYAYRARIWQDQIKKNVEITLKSRDESDACQEAFEVFSKHASDISEGKDIANRRKKLPFYTEKFLEHTRDRVELSEITAKRGEVIGHNLKSLIEFSNLHKSPDLDRLSALYDNNFMKWRAKHKAKITKKQLSKRYLNSELVAHKQFFNWAIKEGFSNRPIQQETLKLKRANVPFPKEHYMKLLSVALKELEEAPNRRIKWEIMNYRTLILLMNGIGCRVVETKNLKWSDIKKKKDHKTGKQRTELYIHGKDKERTIRIPERVAGYLEDLRKFKKKFGHDFWSEEKCPHIFSSWRSPKTSNQYDARMRRRWMKKAGVKNPEDYEFVCFRHKFITDSLNNEVHSLAVAQYTGTSQRMIEKTYSGLVSNQIYSLVFKNAPEQSLSRNASKWFERLMDET